MGKKTIFYTVDYEFYDGDMNLGLTGNKTVNVYGVESGELVDITEINSTIDIPSVNLMDEFFETNNFLGDNFKYRPL